VPGRDDEDEVLVEERRRGQGLLVDRERDDREVQLPRCELRLEGARDALDEPERDTGVARTHGVEQEGDQPAPDGPDHADADRARDLGAQRDHLRGRCLELGERAAGAQGDGLALLGEPTGGSIDERRLELPLEPRDPRRDVGLDRAEGGGGRRERAARVDLDQGLELAQLHPASVSVKAMTSITASGLNDGVPAGQTGRSRSTGNPPS